MSKTFTDEEYELMCKFTNGLDDKVKWSVGELKKYHLDGELPMLEFLLEQAKIYQSKGRL